MGQKLDHNYDDGQTKLQIHSTYIAAYFYSIMPFAGNGADGHAAAPEKPQLALLSALPNDCPTYTWASFRHLESMANEVYQQLNDKQESGNQYLVVLGLTKDVITTLLNDVRRCCWRAQNHRLANTCLCD